MSINAKLDRLSLDLHNVSQQASTSTPKLASASRTARKEKSSSPIAESWEDASLSESDGDVNSPSSDSSVPVEAPGPNIKSPQTRAVDAERELSGEFVDSMQIPPPTPISPQTSNMRADWSPAANLGGGRPIYTSAPSSTYPNSNPSSSARSTPTGPGSMTPTHRYPTPNPPVDSTSRERDADRDRKRPEKTTATANRLIAGALGIKAPPKTEEQRRYDRAVKEQEIRRRNREREEKKREEEENEKAKTAVWDT